MEGSNTSPLIFLDSEEAFSSLNSKHRQFLVSISGVPDELDLTMFFKNRPVNKKIKHANTYTIGTVLKKRSIRLISNLDLIKSIQIN